MEEDDEILVQEVREQLQGMDLDDEAVEFQLAEMRDAGMFRTPSW